SASDRFRPFLSKLRSQPASDGVHRHRQSLPVGPHHNDRAKPSRAEIDQPDALQRVGEHADRKRRDKNDVTRLWSFRKSPDRRFGGHPHLALDHSLVAARRIRCRASRLQPGELRVIGITEMLMITEQLNNDVLIFKLAGALAGDWALEFHRCWVTAAD